jgi:hypothetical protein
MRPRRAGFTVIELAIALVLLVVVSIKAAMLFDFAAESQLEDAADLALEDQARRTLDQIAFAVMGADRETLFPDPEAPAHETRVEYKVSLGVQDGEVVWGDPEEIALSGQDSQVVWSQNKGQPEERHVVWSNVVRPYLEGEVLNGVDDNDNGLIDEKGLMFTLQGNRVTIRLSLQRAQSTGTVLTQSVETSVTLRN